jgi:hypothetical protein
MGHLRGFAAASLTAIALALGACGDSEETTTAPDLEPAIGATGATGPAGESELGTGREGQNEAGAPSEQEVGGAGGPTSDPD